jgi:hypothetical protein
MTVIGRKRYHAWSDTLTIGIGVITDKWSSFIQNPTDTAILVLYDLCDFDGEITPFPIGKPLGNFFGRDVNFLLTENSCWLQENISREPRIGFCGRRLISTWTDQAVLVIDKIVGDPARFGIAAEQGRSAMIYDIHENVGELFEKRVGPPEVEAYGQTPNWIFQLKLWETNDEANSQHNPLNGITLNPDDDIQPGGLTL